MTNGEHLPTIHMGWDHKTQSIKLDFDKEEFRTWEFIQSILQMGIEYAKVQAQMSRMMQMQKQQMEAQVGQALASKVNKQILQR